jgi:hypothetical protein
MLAPMTANAMPVPGIQGRMQLIPIRRNLAISEHIDGTGPAPGRLGDHRLQIFGRMEFKKTNQLYPSIGT